MHSIAATNLGWNLPDGRPLFTGLDFHIGPERIGLVGANGVGKSTLLAILAGRIAPHRGIVSVRGCISMVPQDVESYRSEIVASALGVLGLWEAWVRVQSGAAIPEDMDTLSGHWDLEERCLAALSRVGLTSLHPSESCGHLSGGELLRVVFAGAWIKPSNFLILDEPSNHLDCGSRNALQQLIAQREGGLLVASHDRELLCGMDRIVELSPSGLRSYGGDYTFYRRTLENEVAAAAAALAESEAELRRSRKEERKTLERQSKRAVRGAKGAADQGLPKIILGMRKRKAQESSAKLGKVHAERVEKSLAAARQAREGLREDARICIDPVEAAVPNARILLQAQALNMRFPDGSWLWTEPVDLEIRGPERVGLLGDNGAGKSLLLAMVLGRLQPSCGQVIRGARHMGLLDQSVGFLESGQSVFGNLRAHAVSDVSDSELRIRLGRYHFPGTDALKPVSVLSGGEKMRAGLACLLATGRPLDLLLLDEPGNNLDLGGQEALESALGAFRGAMIVVSHDKFFLEKLGLTRWITLKSSGRSAPR